MAITPKEAQQRAAPAEEVLKDLETRIDEQIIDTHRQGSTFTSFWSKELDNAFTREEITRRYERAGWTVEYTDNQRDGQYLTLAPEEFRGGQRDALVRPYER